MTKRILPPAGRAAQLAGSDIIIAGSPITFRAVVADYMLAKGQGARFSARIVPIKTSPNGTEAVQRSLSIAVINALDTPGTLTACRELVDRVNRAALLAEYATPTPERIAA